MRSLSRREFQKRALGALAGSQALAWGAWGRAQEPELDTNPLASPTGSEEVVEEATSSNGPFVRPNLLYGLATTSWAREVPPGQPLPLIRILDETAASGFNGLRIHTYPKILEDNNMSIEQLSDELGTRGLKFCSIPFGGRYYDRKKQQELMDQARDILRIHQYFGARTMTVYMPTMPQGLRTEDKEFDDLFEQMCQFLSSMGRMAVDHFGVRIGVQNHMYSMVETPEHVRSFLKRTDRRYVYGWWDTAHLHLAGGSVKAILRSTLPNLVGLDFKDATRHPKDHAYKAPNGEHFAGDTPQGRYYNSMFELGRGSIDFPEILRMMEPMNWRGWLIHDLDTIRTSCAESFRHSMSYIRRELDPIYM
ncbi:MAG: sugar phosphate isomerase/epimerase [Pirellulales bacterium]|nr:sugar phosphate isomerase/epimerase [Pirellulales bacterium]